MYLISIMKSIIFRFLFVSVMFFMFSCGNEKTETKSVEAKGGVFYGGVFKLNELENFKNLYPHSIVDVFSQRITNQVYEGLVKFSQEDLTILPSLAYKWESNPEQTVWTFYIRKGVKFHNNACFPDEKGREITAADFKYCFDKICEADANNSAFDLTFKDKVQGANEYYASTKNKKPLSEGVSGIQTLNDSTLQIKLNYPYSGFLNILAMANCVVFPKEAVEKYGTEMRINCIGTGPFRIKNIKEGEVVILEKNPDYWGFDEHGNQLPYLDAIQISFIKEKKAEMLEFQKGNLYMMFRIPVELYKEIMGNYQNANANKMDFDIQSVEALGTNYYGLLLTGPAFSKKEVRQAFNYAIDREKIVNFTLQGEGVPGSYGIVPPVETFEKQGYNFASLSGYSLNINKAQELMKKAGYTNGKGFPKTSLTINSGGNERNQQIAEVIQKMLKENLNIDIDINVIPFAEQLDACQSGKLDFFRVAWSADFPDPNTFLSLFYGKNVPQDPNEKSYFNTSRFKNQLFDEKFERALKEPDLALRMNLYKECDQILLDEAAFIPVFYEENARLIQKNVRNFPANSMEYRDFSKVYFVPKNTKEKN